MNDNKVWYAGVAGKQEGPFSIAEVATMLSSGKLTAESLVWKEGMADWVPISQVPEFSTFMAKSSAPSAVPSPVSSPAKPKASGQAKAALVCGIISATCFGFLAAPFALIFGIKVLRKKDANPRDKKFASWGIGLSSFSLVMLGLSIAFNEPLAQREALGELKPPAGLTASQLEAYVAGSQAAKDSDAAWNAEPSLFGNYEEDLQKRFAGKYEARDRIHRFHRDVQQYFLQGWADQDTIIQQEAEKTRQADREKNWEETRQKKRAKGWVDVDE